MRTLGEHYRVFATNIFTNFYFGNSDLYYFDDMRQICTNSSLLPMNLKCFSKKTDFLYDYVLINKKVDKCYVFDDDICCYNCNSNDYTYIQPGNDKINNYSPNYKNNGGKYIKDTIKKHVINKYL